MIDTKPYIRHHALIGYEYAPNYEAELPQPGGGRYRLKTNAAGLRADREFNFAAPPGKKRLIVLGDSFAAGQYVSNEDRFSELLERRRTDWEVINLGLEGTGTDQQLLIYEEVGRKFEHDAVLLLPFLQNIRRNLVEARESFDPKTKAKILLPKPRFELTAQGLELRNVPVPTERQAVVVATDVVPNVGFKSMLNRLPGMRIAKRLLSGLKPLEPFPEYRSAFEPAWRLMRAILERLAEAVGPRPLLVAPAFYVSYVRHRMARSFLDRFTEFAAARPLVTLIDLQPAFDQLGTDAERAFFEPHDCHWSPFGHLVLADALAPELDRAAGLASALAVGHDGALPPLDLRAST